MGVLSDEWLVSAVHEFRRNLNMGPELQLALQRQ
jgi:hypothetical protein